MDNVRDTLAPSAELKIGDETYRLSFTYDAIAEAKRELLRYGVRCNLLLSLDSYDIDALELRALFYAATRLHHPELSYEQVKGLLTMQNYGSVFEAILKAYVVAMKPPQEQEENPTPAQEG